MADALRVNGVLTKIDVRYNAIDDKGKAALQKSKTTAAFGQPDHVPHYQHVVNIHPEVQASKDHAPAAPESHPKDALEAKDVAGTSHQKAAPGSDTKALKAQKDVAEASYAKAADKLGTALSDVFSFSAAIDKASEEIPGLLL